mmetsp:Transcript_6861/g.15719  ORF Transcript_6861/g.15719 Transcript_6861/m.15719 type:complete len:223 (+) Transcript_6861:223-891(+)
MPCTDRTQALASLVLFLTRITISDEGGNAPLSAFNSINVSTGTLSFDMAASALSPQRRNLSRLACRTSRRFTSSSTAREYAPRRPSTSVASSSMSRDFARSSSASLSPPCMSLSKRPAFFLSYTSDGEASALKALANHSVTSLSSPAKTPSGVDILVDFSLLTKSATSWNRTPPPFSAGVSALALGGLALGGGFRLKLTWRVDAELSAASTPPFGSVGAFAG